MDIRIITLKYSEGLGGFPEEDLRKAVSSREVLDVREYYYEYAKVPHMTFVVTLGAKYQRNETVRQREEDPELSVPEQLRNLYREIRQWRNEKARKEGVPSYLVLRNAQIAEICRRIPRSLTALKEIEGIGEATCAKYGKEILSLIPEEINTPSDNASSDEHDAEKSEEPLTQEV